jgi:hypothetical protein
MKEPALSALGAGETLPRARLDLRNTLMFWHFPGIFLTLHFSAEA